MIRIPSSPALGTELGHTVTQRLKQQSPSQPGAAVERELETRARARLGTADWVTFRLLHRQFGGRLIPGLSLVVWTSDWLRKGFKALRGTGWRHSQ